MPDAEVVASHRDIFSPGWTQAVIERGTLRGTFLIRHFLLRIRAAIYMRAAMLAS
jgi:hypothetical protein